MVGSGYVTAQPRRFLERVVEHDFHFVGISFVHFSGCCSFFWNGSQVSKNIAEIIICIPHELFVFLHDIL